MSIESKVVSALSHNISNVKECSCELIKGTFLRMFVVSNVFEGMGKLIERHEYVEEVLKKANLTTEISPFRIQIVAWTRNEHRRREKIKVELQPGYKPPKRKSKSSKGIASSKKRSATTTTTTTPPLATKSNVKSRTKADDDFIVDDDDTSECSWDSSDDESMADEQDDDSESDDEFDKMMLESDDDESDDASADWTAMKEARRADEVSFDHCVCGEVHGMPFWLQCDGCDAWYHVAKECVGFDQGGVTEDEKWYCRECKPVVKVPKSIMADLQPQVL